MGKSCHLLPVKGDEFLSFSLYRSSASHSLRNFFPSLQTDEREWRKDVLAQACDDAEMSTSDAARERAEGETECWNQWGRERERTAVREGKSLWIEERDRVSLFWVSVSLIHVRAQPSQQSLSFSLLSFFSHVVLSFWESSSCLGTRICELDVKKLFNFFFQLSRATLQEQLFSSFLFLFPQKRRGDTFCIKRYQERDRRVELLGEGKMMPRSHHHPLIAIHLIQVLLLPFLSILLLLLPPSLVNCKSIFFSSANQVHPIYSSGLSVSLTITNYVSSIFIFILFLFFSISLYFFLFFSLFLSFLNFSLICLSLLLLYPFLIRNELLSSFHPFLLPPFILFFFLLWLLPCNKNEFEFGGKENLSFSEDGKKEEKERRCRETEIEKEESEKEREITQHNIGNNSLWEEWKKWHYSQLRKFRKNSWEKKKGSIFKKGREKT